MYYNGDSTSLPGLRSRGKHHDMMHYKIKDRHNTYAEHSVMAGIA